MTLTLKDPSLLVEANLIDGAFIGTPALDVTDPATGAVLARVPLSDAEATTRAVEAAAAALPAWGKLLAKERARLLRRWFELIIENRDDLALIMTSEQGKPLAEAKGEIDYAAGYVEFYAEEAKRIAGETLPSPRDGARVLVIRQAAGVVAAITPWNFPAAMITRKVAPALAAGCTAVVKPASETPLICSAAVRLLHEAGVPVSALALLVGEGTAGAALTADPRIAGVVFTGSTDTAFAINRALAAKTGPIVPLIAETGGLNAMIVDATALGEQVADDVITSAFRSAGQRCSALRLLLVQEDVADHMIDLVRGAAAELKVGDPRRPDTDIGPIIDREQLDKLTVHIADWQGKGGVLFTGATPAGALAAGTYAAPTIIALPDAAALDKEVFGPVLHVVRYKAKELDKVLGAIAQSGYGLTLGIHSRIESTVKAIVERLPVGNVYVNRNMIGAVVGSQPFGGSGLSGTGPKAGGPNYLARFALEQVVSVNTAAAGGNATLVAMGDE